MSSAEQIPTTRTASYEADPEQVHRVLLLYSGGLDTSVACNDYSAFICDHGLSAPSGSVMLDAETPRFEEPVPPSSDCIEPNVEVPGGRADPNPIRQQQ